MLFSTCRFLPPVALRIFCRKNAIYKVAWNMENPVINGISTFADCFTLLECSMGKLFPKLFTSGHSGTVGEELVR